MSVLTYLQSRLAAVAAGTASIVATCVIAAVCGCLPQAVTLMVMTLVLGMGLSLAFEYARNHSFYRDLRELCASLERPYQLHSLLRRPHSPDQQEIFDVLEVMGRACSNDVTSANARVGEHREFVEGWIHGVKAPLASCALVAERIPEPERSQLRHELDRISRKVDLALWYARSDNANSDYLIREVALAEITARVCRENARFLIEHGCIPSITINPEVTVLTDAKQVSFIVTQLVENAAKYGAQHLTFSIEEADSPNVLRAIVLNVEDDGCGIPARDIDRIFERGFTGTTGHADASSTGMGLYLASRLCKQLGLDLTISSTEGKGTRAALSFPLDRRHMDLECDKSESLR